MLLCVYAKKNVKYDKNSFYLEKCKRNYKYCGTGNFHILNQMRGKLFEVYSKEEYLKNRELLAGTYDIFDNDLENEEQPNYVILDEFDDYFIDSISRVQFIDKKIFINESEEIDYFPQYSIVKFVREDIENRFIQLLKDMLESSNIKTCVLLISVPVARPEKIVGPITLNKFIEMVKNNQIYDNIEYIICQKDKNDNYWDG